ncbi:MAG TPA: hypothetical protein VI731_04005, partial [Bacteroidia bacterium]|nr:hypothetical protein [Bacteroidia bacterium]
MKKITLLFSALIVACAMNAQTIVFHEDFETADSVASSGSPTWGQEGVLQVSGSFSYRNQVATSTASYLTTNAFSTIGNSFVLLDFEQICKIEFNDAGTVEVSNDNGTTWTQLTANEYLGVAAFATMGNRFASNSYSGAWVPGNNSAVPNNTWWWHEQFDISSLVSNAAQVKVRFKLSDINNNGSNSNYGWILDDVIVTASPSELNPPVIIQLNPI